MKIIEAMKKIKDLQIKANDIRDKLAKNHAYLNYETPTYGDEQKNKIREWLQAHRDIVNEILSLRVAIQKTNINTDVTIQLNGKGVSKSIAEWIHRRRDLADLDMQAWMVLTDKGLKEGKAKNSSGEDIEVKIIRCYDPEERDNYRELYRSEPSQIDSTLEVTNAVTDLL